MVSDVVNAVRTRPVRFTNTKPKQNSWHRTQKAQRSVQAYRERLDILVLDKGKRNKSIVRGLPGYKTEREQQSTLFSLMRIKIKK